MSFNSNGQISYLVLDSLSSGSKYGLEIIEYISKKTGGNYIMKKPTLYSCLTRMEKKGLVSSSYWGESELGGKRHYYSITNSGKANLEELSRIFANTTFDEIENKESTTNSTPSYKTNTEDAKTEDDSPKILHQGNIFDLVKEQKSVQHTNTEAKSDIVENQIDIFNMEPITQPTTNDAVFLEENETLSEETQDKMTYYQNKLEQSPVQEPAELFDGGKFLDENERLSPDQEEQNKRLYDTSSELKRYRKKKSFSENQIEMAVVYEEDDYDQIQKERIAELKKSLLNLKQADVSAEEVEKQFEEPSVQTPSTQYTQQSTTFNNFDGFYTKNEPQKAEQDSIRFETEYVEQRPIRKSITPESEEDIVNDAIFITEPRVDEIPIQRKITPPNIEVNVYDNNLPAPKRDSELEPTYRDMMAKLFEKKKEKEIKRPTTNQQVAQPTIEKFDNKSFADYSTLKRYYNSQGITFKEYQKTNVERKHNTNLLNLISSSILLLLSAIGCSILFGIISGTHNLKSSTNFMFYTLPILFAVLVAVDFILLKFTKSKKAKLFYNDAVNWIVFVLGVIVVCIINICCKMQFETIAQFSTTLFVPILGLLLLFPANYYIKKYLYKVYAK